MWDNFFVCQSVEKRKGKFSLWMGPMAWVVCVFMHLLPVGRGVDGRHWVPWTRRWACPCLVWPLIPGTRTYQGVKGEAMATNEADYSTGMVQRVRQEGRLQMRKVGVVMWRCWCPTHTGSEWAIQCGGECAFGLVDAVWFLWNYLWASGGQSVLGWELGSLRQTMLLL